MDNISLKRKLCYSILVTTIFCAGLEFGARKLLMTFYPSDSRLNREPMFEFDKDLKYHIRKDVFNKMKDVYIVGMKEGPSGDVPLVGFLSLNGKEGVVRGANGDAVVNKWGFRGPYFEKEINKERIYRIVALGESTTAGMYQPDEMTYPRILERMLNFHRDSGVIFQVINAGHWGYTSCQANTLYMKEIRDFNPDMVLVMSGWNDVSLLRSQKIKSREQYCSTGISVLDNSNLYRLLKFRFPAKGENVTGNTVYNQNYYIQNLKEIISDARNKGVQVGLVGLPSVKNDSIATNDGQVYEKWVGAQINGWKQQLALDNSNTFYVDTGVSFNTKGKEGFFSDDIHPTGS